MIVTRQSGPGSARTVRTLLGGFLVAALLLAASCATITLEPQPPAGFDLSGAWQLDADASETLPARRVLRARGGLLGIVLADFPVLRARELRIEQGRDSMGIYYDGRNYRDVSWGTRRRGLWEVRAGWHEGDLVILSDAKDAEARERFTLSPDGQRLRLEVEVSSGGQDVALVRVFRRVQVSSISNAASASLRQIAVGDHCRARSRCARARLSPTSR